MNYTELSKTISHALRHAPNEYGLHLNDEGWVEIVLLLKSLGEKRIEWQNLKLDNLIEMINKSEKKRHEIDGNYIRAIYGHSVDGKFQNSSKKPPNILYHGTSRDSVSIILRDGIKPMERQYVHLSQIINEAERIGQRKDNYPVILIVNSEKAYLDGVKFYESNDKIWLSNHIPSKYISI